MAKPRSLPLIIGNWKTTPATLAEALKHIKTLDKNLSGSDAKKIKGVKALPKKAYYLAAPDIFISHLAELSERGIIGSQNISAATTGQVTGVVTPSQLLTGGASFALVGHSEVRAQGETREERANKVALSLQSKLMTVFCVGEKVRDAGGNYLAELEEDVRETLALVKREYFEHLVIAYEPVWAIGGTKAATPQECFEVVIAIRRALASLVGIDYAKKVHVLYGGTVTEDNAKAFIEDGGVDGLLVGRASQDAITFANLIRASHL